MWHEFRKPKRRDAKDVTEASSEIFSLAPINIAPGEHVLLHGSCAISQPGRILSLYGHRHANNLRFSAWRIRGGQKTTLLDDYDWEEPAVFEYSSIVTNPMANEATKTAGGYSGVLDVMSGDTIDFECDIVNKTNKTFRGANEAHDDEVCILVGDAVKTSVPPFCTYTTTPASN